MASRGSGINAAARTTRDCRGRPWDAVDSGVDKKFLLKDIARAQREAEVEDCAWGKCLACSACDFKTKEPIVYPKESLAIVDKAPPAVLPPETTLMRVFFAKRGI